MTNRPARVRDREGHGYAAVLELHVKLGEKSEKIFKKVQKYDAVIFAGQAKSHCVAWTLSDLLDQIQEYDPDLVSKVYLLEDCSSPVVVPGVIDYTDQADADFARFTEAGMNIVHSTEQMTNWPGLGE